MSALNDFDKQQIQLLAPLFDEGNPIILHYPFYANTFPLAYHYYLLLKQRNVAPERIKDLIKPHIWATEFPSQPNRLPYLSTSNWNEPQHINIFYANELKAKEIIKDVNKFPPEKLDTVFYTKFVHRFLFLEYNPWSLAIHRNHPKSGVEPQMLNDRHFSNTSDYSQLFITFSEIERELKESYKRINIYTDLPVEAQHLFLSVFKGIETVIYEQSELNFINDEENEVLNIYFYGGPTAFHYLSKSDRFIPILIDQTRAKAMNTAKGVVCVHYNGDHLVNRVNEINQALTTYHKNLFGMSVLETGALYLNNIRISYNKLAKILNHPSYFRNAQAFANCIAVHHEGEETDQQFVCDYISSHVSHNKSPVCDSYNLVHIGAGKLGVGLVLPLFHSNNSCVTVSVVQKSRSGGFDWKTLSKDNNITMSARYGCHNEGLFKWNLNLNVTAADKYQAEKNTFMLIDEYSEILNVLKKADVITFSLGDRQAQKQFVDFIKHHKSEFSKEVFIFPFENSSEISDSENLTPFIKFRILKPDRICIDRYLEDHTINVTNENHYEVVIKALDARDEKQIRHLFDPEIAANKLIICDTNKKYEFYEKRKKYLLNELHFVLAVYGYHFLIDKKINNWQYQYVTVIQSALKDNPEYSKPIDTYIKLQILRIITECDEQTYFKETGTIDDYEIVANSLLRYADQVKTRFNESEADPLHRVFAISTLFDEVDIAKFTFPDTEKIEKKYKENYSELNTFYKNYYTSALSKNYTLRPPSVEINAFLTDYKDKLNQVFRRAAWNAEQADYKTKKVIDRRKQKLESFNAEITKILSEGV